jgi:hypothetical protein
MTTPTAIATSMIAASPTPATTWDQFVTNVGIVESGMNIRAIGDRGRARGAWQMHRAAWNDASDFQRRRGLPAWDFDLHSTSPIPARRYADVYLQIIRGRLQGYYHRKATYQEIYAAYNLGPTKFIRKYKGDLKRCPKKVQDAARRTSNHL